MQNNRKNVSSLFIHSIEIANEMKKKITFNGSVGVLPVQS